MRFALAMLSLGAGVLLVSCAVGEDRTTVAEPSPQGNRAQVCATDRSFSDVAGFGSAVAGFGGVLAVGSPAHDAQGGAVLLFDESAGTAVGVIPDVITTAGTGDGFGGGIAAFGTGLAVGAPAAGDGTVYLFDSSNTLTQTIPAPGTTTTAFGLALASYNGDLFVGDPYGPSGAVYEFDGATGALVRTIANPVAEDDHFGEVLAVGANYLYVGASLAASGDGAVHVFDAATGTFVRTLSNPAPAGAGRFGRALATSGTQLLVGALDASSDAGRAFVFDGPSGVLGTTVLPPAGTPAGVFGASVAFVGSELLVGAPDEPVGGNPAGAIYLFQADGTFLFRIAAPDPSASIAARFGAALDGASGMLLVGEPGRGNAYVYAENRAPAASPRSVTAIAGTSATFAVTATDPNLDPLTYAVAAAPAHGTVSGTTGVFVYTPDPGYSGADSFKFVANDGCADSNQAKVTITVDAPPVAANDSYTTSEDTALTVSAALGVLANDSDPDSASLTASVVTSVAHGTLALNASGSFTYTPTANYNGTDSFTYRVSDGLAFSNTATVQITITPVNDAPVAAADAYTTPEDTALNVAAAAGVLANDVDVDSAITAVLVGNVSHGTLTFSTDGSFGYVPNANYNGPDSFTYKAFDGALYSAVVTVSISVTPVDDPPVAQPDAYLAVEDTPRTVSAASGLLANDSDIDSPSLTAVLVNSPAHGSVSLNADGSFTYTPAPNFNGNDFFTYKASDSQMLSGTTVVTMIVAPVNDPPVTVNDSYVTTAQTPLHVDAAQGVLANDSDVDSPAFTALLAAAPTHGALTLGSNGAFDYVPASGFVGDDTFRYRALDSSASISAEATVTISVVPVANPPTVPTLSSPADGATVKPGATLRWAPSTDPDGSTIRYDVEIRRAGAVVANLSSPTPEIALPGGLGEGSFQWAVRAVDSTKQASDYSAPWTFVIVDPARNPWTCSTTSPTSATPRGAGLLLGLGSLAFAVTRARRR